MPERIELREMTLADETVMSDNPVHLSCVTLTFKENVRDGFWHFLV